MMEWYYRQGNEKFGPFDDHEFHELVSRGRVSQSTLVYRRGMREWQPLEKVELRGGVLAADAGSSLLDPVDSSAPWDHHYADWGLGESHREQFASAERRAVAKFFDWTIMGGLFFAITLAAGYYEQPATGDALPFSTMLFRALGDWWFVPTLVPIGLRTFFIGRFGATPGKWALNLRVVRTHGETMTYGRALARALAESLTHLSLGLGYLVAFYDLDVRTLHDILCDTRVERVQQ